MQAGKVHAVRYGADFRAASATTVASDLARPVGVAYQDGRLYVSEINRILRFDDIEQRLENPPEAVTVIDEFPTETHHGWKFIAFGPDGKLYVPVGAPCNICDPGKDFAKIISMKPDGSDWRVAVKDPADPSKFLGVLTAADTAAFAGGIVLADGLECLPAGLELLSPQEALVTLREGKFHQVKRMLAACGKPVTYLKRLSMGPLRLDPELAPGAFRMLTVEEKKALADCR